MLLCSGEIHPFWVKSSKEHTPKSLHVNVGIYLDDSKTYERWGDSYHEVNKKCDSFALYFNVNECYYFCRLLKTEFSMTRLWVIHPMLNQMNWMQACEGKKRPYSISEYKCD